MLGPMKSPEEIKNVGFVENFQGLSLIAQMKKDCKQQR
jgi:hypothetical protein